MTKDIRMTRIGMAALVLAGGSAGTALRLLVGSLIASPPSFPVSTFAINVSGAFLLGVVYGLTAHVTARAQRLRALLGTGVLGGYTTYSMFAVGTDGLILTDQFAATIAYALPTVVLGTLAAGLGMSITHYWRKRAS
jgi:fluoride exporter